jgi:hypothetical protein
MLLGEVSVFSALFEVFIEVQNVPSMFTVDEYSKEAIKFCKSNPASHLEEKNIFKMPLSFILKCCKLIYIKRFGGMKKTSYERREVSLVYPIRRRH